MDSTVPAVPAKCDPVQLKATTPAVDINSQREIEHAVAKAVAANAIAGTESFPAKMTLEVSGLKVKVEFSGDIALQ